MTAVLLGMHIFWIYFLVIFGIKKVKSDSKDSSTKKTN